MSILREVYASAPSNQVILECLEILIPTYDPIRIVKAYKDYDLTLEDDSTHTFSAAFYEYKPPAKNTTGQQSITIVISNVSGIAQKAVEYAIENRLQVPVIARTYLSTDLTAPAAKPFKMTLRGGTFEGAVLRIDAGYFDTLNYAWPRLRYDASWAPGLRYM